MHRAARSLRSLDGVHAKRSDTEWQTSQRASLLAQIDCHCNALREAVNAVVEFVDSLDTSNQDSVDYSSLGSWIAAFSHHVPPIALGARQCAVLVPVVVKREAIRVSALELCEGVKVRVPFY